MSIYSHIAFSLLMVQLVRILQPYDVKIDIYFYLFAILGNLICFAPEYMLHFKNDITFSFKKLAINKIEIVNFVNSILCYLIFSIVMIILFYTLKFNSIYLLSLEVGYMSHLILESFSIAGVRLLYPSYIRFSLITRKDALFRGFVKGTRSELILAFVLFILFLICLPTESYKKIIHSIIQNPVGALSDVKYEASGKETTVNLKGIHNVTHERIDRQFKAIGWLGANSLVVEDIETGSFYSVGKGITDNIQPFSMEEKTGPTIEISNRNMSVYRTNIKRIIADIERTITDPNTQAYITGDIYTDDENYHVASNPTEYNPIKLIQRCINLQFARLEDLDKLKNAHITSGKLTIRYEKTIPQKKEGVTPAGENYTGNNYKNKTNFQQSYAPAPANINKVKISFNALDMSDIKVKIAQLVKKGDVLAISSKDIETLELENQKSYVDYSKLNTSIKQVKEKYRVLIENKERELELNKRLYFDGLISEQAIKNIENEISHLKNQQALDISSIQSEKDKISLQVDNNYKHIEGLKIMSPIDGEISAISISFSAGYITGSISIE